ncbi:hypothetical protein BH20ACT5_BH20ACT5_11240 [soil metagenome]
MFAGAAGCAASAEAEVAAAAREFFNAFADQDGAELCTRITAADAAAVAAEAAAIGGDSCPEAFAALLASADQAELDIARDIEIDETEIEIDGDTATIPASAAALPGASADGELTLIREDGDWKVDLDL